jgi:predicted transcriptional regulator of viral defense system
MLPRPSYQELPSPVIDYQFLGQKLKEYRSPRAKITQMLKSGELIRLKKGLYLLGEAVHSGFYELGPIANLIYGPSYLSLEWVLAYHGLIPERVEVVTSVTTTKNKSFDTPIGRFTYRYQHRDLYALGTTLETESQTPFLIASKEKALADYLYFAELKLESTQDLREFLENDLRFEMNALKKLSISRLKTFESEAKNHAITLLTELVRNERRA